MSTHLLKLSYYYCIFLLLCHSETALSTLILTPRMVSLCPGDQLKLTCNTSSNLQQWIIVDPNTGMTYTRILSVPTTTEAVITPLQLQSFAFNFAVISLPNGLPLISTLTVDGVTAYLNTSRISCLEIDSGNIEVVSVNIFEPDPLERVNVEYHLTEPTFGLSDVTVMLLFSQEAGLLEYYNVTSSLQVEIQREERTRFQLVIPYNTHINVSITASLCGQLSNSTTIQLNYTNCGDPPVQRSDAERNGTVKVTGNTQDIPVMEGTTISFSCHPGLIFSGPNSSTCMENGEWEPDPREVDCRVPECEIPMNGNKVVYEYNSTTEGSKLIFYCEDNPDESYIAQCYGNETWIPNIALITCGDHDQSFEALSRDGKIAVASLMTVFAGTSILFFIIGFLSGHFCRKERKRDETVLPPSQEIQTPYYDDAVLKQHEEQQLELKDNVAYVSHTVVN